MVVFTLVLGMSIETFLENLVVLSLLNMENKTIRLRD